MQLPDTVKQIRARYVAAFPVPQGAPGDAFEERARQWTTAFAEQVAFELPNQGWGMKRADANRPISKDTIARLEHGRLMIWDLLIGTGTGSPRLMDEPEGDDITGQVFVEVTPTNHLKAAGSVSSVVVAPPHTGGATPPPVSEAAQMVEHLAAIRQTLQALLEEQKAMRAALLAAVAPPRVP